MDILYDGAPEINKLIEFYQIVMGEIHNFPEFSLCYWGLTEL